MLTLTNIKGSYFLLQDITILMLGEIKIEQKKLKELAF
jgi:hypothetical protein